MQGLLELAGVPYVGAGVLGSALAMDKAKAKEVLGARGLPQARWLGVHDDEAGPGLARSRRRELGWPVFVKPANLGSSVGRRRRRPTARRSTGALDLAFVLRRVGRRRGGRHRARDRGGGARQPRSRGVGAGRDRAQPRVLRLRGQVPRRRRPARRPRAALARGHRRGPRAGGRGVRGAARRGHGARRLLLRGGRARLPRQRDRTRFPASRRSRCTRALGGVGRALPEAHRPPRRARARAPRAPGRPHRPRRAPSTGARPGT